MSNSAQKAVFKMAYRTTTGGNGDAGRSPTDAVSHTEPQMQSSIRTGFSYTQQFLFEHPLVHGLLLECRTLCHRILLLYRRGYIGHVYTGWVFLKTPDQGLIANKTEQGRIQGIEKLLEYQPWASPEDRRLFLFAWEMGRRWGVVHGHRLGEEPIDSPVTWESIIGDSQ
jgi:hypothetical protein